MQGINRNKPAQDTSADTSNKADLAKPVPTDSKKPQMPQDKGKEIQLAPGPQPPRKDESLAMDTNGSNGKEVPKAASINRLKNAAKEGLPISKAPRRQRSSRFHVTEHVELEKLAGFKGFSADIVRKLIHKRI